MGGGRKIYHLDGTWPCCSGTYPQVVADYHNVIYFKDADGLYVNLFVPSEVTWNQDGAEIRGMQETTYPESDSTTFTVRTGKATEFALRFRVPGWSQGLSITVNGAPVQAEARPGTWAAVRRTWHAGDRVSLQIPMRLATRPVDPQHPRRVAFTYGPVVLVQNVEPVLGSSSGDVTSSLRKGTGLQFSIDGQRQAELAPFYAIGAGTPYNMYFDIKG